MSNNLNKKPTRIQMPKLVEEILEAQKVSQITTVPGKEGLVEVYGAAVDFMLNGGKDVFSVQPKEMGEKVVELVRAYESIPDEFWLYRHPGTAAQSRIELITQEYIDSNPGRIRIDLHLLGSYWEIERAYKSLVKMLTDFNQENQVDVVDLFRERMKPFWQEQEEWSKARKAAFEKFVEEHKTEIDEAVIKEGDVDGYRRRSIVKEVAGKFKFGQKKPVAPDIENPYVKSSKMDLTPDELKEISKDFE